MSIFNGGDELLIATTNQKKFSEMNKILINFGVKVHSLENFKQIKAPAEGANTFSGNSILKAQYYNLHTNLPTIADDSGLCVEALGGFPGVLSARFATNCGGYRRAAAIIKQKLQNGGYNDYSAYFICSIAVCLSQDNIKIFEGRIDGKVTFPPKGNEGFGYDFIFKPNNYNKTFAELDPSEKNRISHRAIALSDMISYFSNQ